MKSSLTFLSKFFFSITALSLLAGATRMPANLAEVEPIQAAQGGRELLGFPSRAQFAVDSRLRKNVDFWISIYTQYDTHHGLIHDAKYIDHVYEELKLPNNGREASRMEKRAKNHWRDVLLTVHHMQNHPEAMNAEQRMVYNLYSDINEPNKFLNAAHRKRLRFQLGQKDRFIEGLVHSGRYLPLMEDVFRKAGLPVELTRLPFVESSFNINARSKVGASGIWQFMRSTGRIFIHVGHDVDERNDPVRATEAAAMLLKMNYDSLRNWPLAVTAYNHGRKGMMRAVRKVDSEDLEDVVTGYRSRSFGFASSNFFCELLAAIDAEKNADKYFGKIEREKPMDFVEVRLPDSISLTELTRFLHLDRGAIRDLNPGISDGVFSGRGVLPAGYRLRLPHDPGVSKDAATRLFLAGYEQIPATFKGIQKPQRKRKYGKR